jgi:predicted CXXCH cytochrome family protein
METPGEETVLGDFNNAEFRYFGRTTRFFKSGDSFRIATESEKGETENFTVAYTLGYKPLQQYLVETGKGRIQALPFAWDARDKKDGGQRWFHLYPEENVTPDNPLFWTRPQQNWNHMCGDCHTTGFSKNVSADGTTFASRFSETGNGCESCHGPGSAHVNARKSNRAGDALSIPRTQQAQIDQCGACHARRTRLREVPDRAQMLDVMLETWKPHLPQEGLYFVDGQIREEVFEIGSFLQSRMAAEGVLCTDCHDPHTARLRAEGNTLCTQCHAVTTFDRTEHHFHKPETAGAQCVSCHMPARTYMVVDPRRDHRLAIPRPDLSDLLGTPNPCTCCHTDRTNSWAADSLRKRKGTAPAETWNVAAWEAAREQRPASEILNKLSNGPAASANPIAKAAVLASLNTWTPESLSLLGAQRNARDTLANLAIVQAAGRLPLAERKPLLIGLVHDSPLAVRMQAASLLAGTERGTLSKEESKNLDAALAEYRAWLQRDADRAETMAALATLQAAEGNAAAARASFEKALQRDPTSLPVLLNFADFYRSLGDDGSAEPLLLRASALYPEASGAHLALGLLRARQKRTPEAMQELARAAQRAPDDSHTLYVYAVGLYSTGQKEQALSILDKARVRFPANGEISSALQAYCAEQVEAAVCSTRRPH